MKTITLAVVTLLLASAAKAAIPCDLSEADYAALAASQSKLTRDSVQTLAPAKQQLLCNSRAFVKKVVASGGSILAVDDYSPYYLSPAERSKVNRAVDDLLQSQLEGKGINVA